MTFEAHNVKVRWASYLIRSRLEAYASKGNKDKAWREAASAYWPTLMSREPSQETSGLSRKAELAVQTIVSSARHEAGLPAISYSSPQPRWRRR